MTHFLNYTMNMLKLSVKIVKIIYEHPPYITKTCLFSPQYLRYEAIMDWVHPEDKDRKFVFSYSLSDRSFTISEIPQRNSGFMEGTYLKSARIPKPGTNMDAPEYYTPTDLYVGKFTAMTDLYLRNKNQQDESASCWFLLCKYITMPGPQYVKFETDL